MVDGLLIALRRKDLRDPPSLIPAPRGGKNVWRRAKRHRQNTKVNPPSGGRGMG